MKNNSQFKEYIMNVDNTNIAQMSYAQMQNNSSVQAQSAQSGFSPERLEGSEANGGNDHDGDDGAKNTFAQNAQALNQLLSKQKNTIFPTTPQASRAQMEDLQSLLMKSIESMYASSSKAYANNALSGFTGGMNLKA